MFMCGLQLMTAYINFLTPFRVRLTIKDGQQSTKYGKWIILPRYWQGICEVQLRKVPCTWQKFIPMYMNNTCMI